MQIAKVLERPLCIAPVTREHRVVKKRHASMGVHHQLLLSGRRAPSNSKQAYTSTKGWTRYLAWKEWTVLRYG
jgi:hypothetical protein